jgi:hypothetical protein
MWGRKMRRTTRRDRQMKLLSLVAAAREAIYIYIRGWEGGML